MNSQILATLQSEQQIHDAKSHWDIVILPTHSRLRHLVLHFAKYVGKLAVASEEREVNASSTVVDVAIISLAIANSLNIDLSGYLKTSSERRDDKGGHHSEDDRQLASSFFLALAIATGRMAKALESLDHLESYAFRSTIETEVGRVFSFCVEHSEELKLDLVKSIRQRWNAVEGSRIFRNGIPIETGGAVQVKKRRDG